MSAGEIRRTLGAIWRRHRRLIISRSLKRLDKGVMIGGAPMPKKVARYWDTGSRRHPRKGRWKSIPGADKPFGIKWNPTRFRQEFRASPARVTGDKMTIQFDKIIGTFQTGSIRNAQARRTFIGLDRDEFDVSANIFGDEIARFARRLGLTKGGPRG